MQIAFDDFDHSHWEASDNLQGQPRQDDPLALFLQSARGSQ